MTGISAGQVQQKTIQLVSDNIYLALYSRENKHYTNTSNKTIVNLNHIGIQVNDLNAIKLKVKAKGLVLYNHGDTAQEDVFILILMMDREIKVLSYHE